MSHNVEEVRERTEAPAKVLLRITNLGPKFGFAENMRVLNISREAKISADARRLLSNEAPFKVYIPGWCAGHLMENKAEVGFGFIALIDENRDEERKGEIPFMVVRVLEIIPPEVAEAASGKSMEELTEEAEKLLKELVRLDSNKSNVRAWKAAGDLLVASQNADEGDKGDALMKADDSFRSALGRLRVDVEELQHKERREAERMAKLFENRTVRNKFASRLEAFLND